MKCRNCSLTKQLVVISKKDLQEELVERNVIGTVTTTVN